MGKLPQAYHALADYMRVCGDKRHPDDVLALILNEWLQDAVGGKDAGYQWGELYLPDGAELRLHFLGEWYYISVENGDLMHRGLPISPRAWCLDITGSVRNPWRDILVRRTPYEAWAHAHALRRTPQRKRSTHVPERRLARRRAIG